MKKGIILFGILSVGLLTACLVLNNNQIKEENYSPRESSFVPEANEAKGYMDFLQTVRGDYTREDYLRAWEQVKQSKQSSRNSITWWEHGPDNIGGRVRAILVDKDDINHVYAGSVSGGLFESRQRANFWEPVTLFSDNLAVSSICQTMDGTIYVATGHNVESSSGNQGSNANGNGIYYLTRDANQNTTAVTHITGSETYSYINEVRADEVSNQIWVATNQGLKIYTPGTGFTDANTATSGGCKALDVSKDGQVIVCNVGNGRTNVSNDGGATFFDATSTGTNPIPGSAPRYEYAISHERGSNGKYYIYAVRSSSSSLYLGGVHRSEDEGMNWTEIAPANNQAPGSFAPFSLGSGSSGQAWYDMIIGVQSNNPEKMYLGGIQMFSWANAGNWEQISNSYTSQLSSIYVHADQHEIAWDENNRLYVGNDGGVFFSDDNGETFHPANRGLNITQFYRIGASAHGDVIGGTQDNSCMTNYHDNTTWHEFDIVSGGDGFASHISFINRDIIFTSSQYGSFSRSGDRGETFPTPFMPTEFATTGPNNIGCSPGSTTNPCGSFYSCSMLWEDPNDTNSEDSVLYVASQSYSTGDNIEVPSLTSGVNINYTATDTVIYEDTVYFNPAATGSDSIITSIAPANDYNLAVFNYSITAGAHPLAAGDSIYLIDLDTTVEVASTSLIPHYYATNPAVPGDTLDMGNDSITFGVGWTKLMVQDPYQSWLAIGLGGGQGVWITRNALRLSADATEWFKVNHSNIGTVMTMEFSRDGDHLFVGTSSGSLYRLSGLSNIYSPAQGDTTLDVNYNVNPANLATTWTQLNGGSFGAPVTGIAVGSNPEHVVVTLGTFSSSIAHVEESTNAATGAGSFSSIMGSTFPSGLPAYSCVIDRDDPNIIVVGTEMGVYITQDGGTGGTGWEYSSEPFGNVPVFDMIQNWRTLDEGCTRPGEIYIGTHGRGIFSTEDFLSTPDQDQLSIDKYIPEDILIYPNPMQEQGTIAFELEKASNVNVQIFSLSGQLVREINETNLSSGQNNIEFGAADLPKGTYIVKLVAGDKIETSKFIKH